MRELNKLEEYLKENNYVYERIDKYGKKPNDPKAFCLDWDFEERHLIIVYEGKNGNEFYNRQWDVACHPGTYGYSDGLLEAYGNIVDPEEVGDDVEGYLTAEDVIKKLERKNAKTEKRKEEPNLEKVMKNLFAIRELILESQEILEALTR